MKYDKDPMERIADALERLADAEERRQQPYLPVPYPVPYPMPARPWRPISPYWPTGTPVWMYQPSRTCDPPPVSLRVATTVGGSAIDPDLSAFNRPEN